MQSELSHHEGLFGNTLCRFAQTIFFQKNENLEQNFSWRNLLQSFIYQKHYKKLRKDTADPLALKRTVWYWMGIVLPSENLASMNL